MNLLDSPDGPYCPMSGHSQMRCTGGADHLALMRAGVGVSSVTGPTDKELREETRSDHELMADEMHGREIDG